MAARLSSKVVSDPPKGTGRKVRRSDRAVNKNFEKTNFSYIPSGFTPVFCRMPDRIKSTRGIFDMRPIAVLLRYFQAIIIRWTCGFQHCTGRGGV